MKNWFLIREDGKMNRAIPHLDCNLHTKTKVGSKHNVFWLIGVNKLAKLVLGVLPCYVENQRWSLWSPSQNTTCLTLHFNPPCIIAMTDANNMNNYGQWAIGGKNIASHLYNVITIFLIKCFVTTTFWQFLYTYTESFDVSTLLPNID